MRNMILINIILAAIVTSSVNTTYAKEPANLGTVKTTLVNYHDSGEYLKDQAKVIDQAMQYLKTRIAQAKKSHHSKKLAIVLDIDETSLSNYRDMVSLNFGGTMEEIDQGESNGNDPAITPTLQLYRYAKQNNVAVFFVTGRRENIRAATAKNLQDAGYQQYDQLILKPMAYQGKSAATYKIHARAEIEKQGFDIVLNIGDQQSDLVGGYADKTFKLPNPYYVVP